MAICIAKAIDPRRNWPALLPLHVCAGRIKNQAHWQIDILVGRVVGGILAWYARSSYEPILFALVPQGFAVGWQEECQAVLRASIQVPTPR